MSSKFMIEIIEVKSKMGGGGFDYNYIENIADNETRYFNVNYVCNNENRLMIMIQQTHVSLF